MADYFSILLTKQDYDTIRDLLIAKASELHDIEPESEYLREIEEILERTRIKR